MERTVLRRRFRRAFVCAAVRVVSGACQARQEVGGWEMTPQEDSQLGRIEEKLDKLDGRVQVIETRFAQWGGIVTGVVLTVSAVWAALIGAWQFVKHKFG